MMLADQPKTDSGSQAAVSEQLQRLLPGLASSAGGQRTPQRILLTSVENIPEAQVIAADVARSCAAGGYRTLAVDANLQQPMLHRLFGIGNERGLSDLLSSTDPPHRLSQATDMPNLTVIPSGPRPQNSSGLLSSEDVFHRVDPIARKFDFIIVDCTRLAPALATAVAESADVIIILAKRHGTRVRTLSSLLELLKARRTVEPTVLLLET